MPGFPVASMMNPIGLGAPLGVIMTGVPTVLVGLAKQPIAVRGLSMSTPHFWGGIPPKPIHPPNPVVLNCSERVLSMGGQAVAHVGSIFMCKHMVLPFPPNITVQVGAI